MSPEDARDRYATAWRFAQWIGEYDDTDRWWLLVDAASIAYDLTVAEASLKRVRESVAW